MAVLNFKKYITEISVKNVSWDSVDTTGGTEGTVVYSKTLPDKDGDDIRLIVALQGRHVPVGREWHRPLNEKWSKIQWATVDVGREPETTYRYSWNEITPGRKTGNLIFTLIPYLRLAVEDYIFKNNPDKIFFTEAIDKPRERRVVIKLANEVVKKFNKYEVISFRGEETPLGLTFPGRRGLARKFFVILSKRGSQEVSADGSVPADDPESTTGMRQSGRASSKGTDDSNKLLARIQKRGVGKTTTKDIDQVLKDIEDALQGND